MDEIALRDHVLSQLRKVIDPDLHKDIVSLGFIKKLKIDYEAGSIAFDLELTTPACPVKDEFVETCTRLLKEIGWVITVDINVTAQKIQRAKATTRYLDSVSYIIAVASCKGGVGKSTTAVNLAYALSRMGASVGLADLDIYGPSLPSLIPLPVSSIRGEASGALLPVEHAGVKLISYGWIKPDEFAAVRGPIASGVAEQLVTGVKWGSLDYLILDLPPGTGDIHLSLVQSVPITAAVLVTTPQTLAVVDVLKGQKFFNEVRIPTVAVVENMAALHCGCGRTHRPFSRASKGLRVALRDALGSASEGDDAVLPFPMHQLVGRPDFPSEGRLANAEGRLFPLVLKLEELHAQGWRGCDDRDPLYDEEDEEEEECGASKRAALEALRDLYVRLARRVAREVSVVRFRDRAPEVSFDVDARVFSLVITRRPEVKRRHEYEDTDEEDEAAEAAERAAATAEREVLEALTVPARTARLACRCAECVDERSGQVKLVARKIPASIRPSSMRPIGNFAVEVTWEGENHTSLLSYAALEKLGRELQASLQKDSLCAQGASLDW